MGLRLGKLAYQPSPLHFQLRTFMAPSQMPTPPPKLDRISKHHGDLRMYGNDQYGDCVLAAAAHIEMIDGAAVGRQIQPTEALIVKTYKEWTGCKVPGDANDTGLYMADALKRWQHDGIARHKIGPYVQLAVGDYDLIPTCVYLFGAVYLGFAVPQSVFAQFADGLWTAGPSPMNSGHAVDVADYPDGWGGQNYGRLISWGQGLRFTEGWWRQYVDEAWVPLPADWRTRDPIPGIDYDHLSALLNQVGSPA